MHSLSRPWTFTCIFLSCLICPVSCIPRISFPVNSQYPPVGRVSQPYSFTFSEATFSSDISPLFYEIRDGPPWLKLNGETRTLSGTPMPQDVGSLSLNLVARDDTGEMAQRITLVISSDPSPRLEMPAEEQLAKYGKMSPQGGLLLPQGQPFEFILSPATFSDQDRIKEYSAVSSNNSPLPSWLNFDPATLKFTGTALTLDSPQAPPQSFGVKLLAQDILGFEGASAQFFLVITHKLQAAKPEFKVTAVSGVDFSLSIPLENILFDGLPILRESVRNITVYAPSWITVDYDRLRLTGMPRTSFRSQIVTIIIEDIFSNEAVMSISIDVASELELFTTEIGNFNVTRGQYLEYKLNSTLFNQPVDLSVTFNPKVEWIMFDQLTRTLRGQVPTNAEGSGVQVNITAETESGASQTQSFNITVEDGAPSSRGNTNNRYVDPIEEAREKAARKKLRTILLATFLPLSILALAFIILCCLTRRQFTSPFKAKSPKERSGTPTCDMISRPIHNSISTQPWPIATLPGKNPTYSRVVERKYSPGPGFVGIGLPTIDPRREGGQMRGAHTKNFSVGSNLLMRMGDPSFGTGYSSNTTLTSFDSTSGTPRRLASIPTLTRIVSGEPIGKNLSGESGTIGSEESRNWEPASRGSDESLTRSASARRSWRKTMMWGQRSGTRDSDASVDTVSTTEVFSVKLVGSPILLGDGKEAKQWQPKGLERVDEPSRRTSLQDRNSGYDWDFGDTLGGIGWIPRPSPARYSTQSLQRDSEPFEDYGIAMGSPTIPNLPGGGFAIAGQPGPSTRTADTEARKLTKGKGERMGKNKTPELQAGVKKGLLVGYGWKF